MENKEIINKIADLLDLGTIKKSNNNLQMLCPFHNESKPSFGINIENGMYHCFACGASGTISNLSNNIKGHIVAEEIEDILQVNIKTLIDGVSYKTKPIEDFDSIVTRISIKDNFRAYTIHDIISLIVRGHSIAPAGIIKENDWKEQQIVLLDFDNKETNYTRNEVLEYAKTINLVPTFTYYTFSNSNDKEKFRFVYCFKEPITAIEQIKCIMNNLYSKFYKYSPDTQCKNLNRVYLGTNNTNIELSNCLYSFNERYTKEQLEELQKLINNKQDATEKDIQYISAKELISLKLTPPHKIVENMLCQGFTILCGSPKVGKSWLCLDLCLSICSGLDFLGFKTNKCSCLYLALEDSYYRLQDRIKKLLKDPAIPEGFNIAIDCPSLDNGLITMLTEHIKNNPQTQLIIIDTLQKIRTNPSRTDSCYSFDYKEISKLKAFADKNRICILAIHHLRKMKDSDVFNQISGSTGLTGAADTMIVLNKDTNSKEVLLSITGRDVESTDKIITFNKETFKWDVVKEHIDLAKQRTLDSYNNNPIVITIKKLLEENSNVIKITASELLQEIIETTGVLPKESTPNSLTRSINDSLKWQLLANDNINYQSPNPNGGSKGRQLYFSKIK